MKSLLMLILLASYSTLALAKSTLTFPLKPFETGLSSPGQIQEGLTLLYSGKKETSPVAPDNLSQAQSFQNFLYQKMNAALATSPNWTYETESKVVLGGFVKETTVRFPSLIQRSPGHPANTVVARLYEPIGQKQTCQEPRPTAIFLHHILNQVPRIEEMAKLMASGNFSAEDQKINVAVIHFPLFGDRTKVGEDFLTADFDQLKLNMAQTILDTRMLKLLLETLPSVKKSRIKLSGISLGAVLGMTIGAFDQSYDSYGFLVGGADMANALMNRVRTRPNSEVAQALKSHPRSEAEVRAELAVADGYTWLHRFRGKDFFFLNASRDDIINYDVAVAPLVQTLKKQGNKVSQRVNDDTHTPEGSGFSKFKDVLLPLMRFLTADATTFDKMCPAQEAWK